MKTNFIFAAGVLLFSLFLSGCSGSDTKPLTGDIEKHGYVLFGEQGKGLRVVVFSDFLCPYCSMLALETEPVFKEYADKGELYFYFVDYALHKNSVQLAAAARCAADQGKQWEMHLLLFGSLKNGKNLGAMNSEQLGLAVLEFSKQLSLNSTKFMECYSGRTHEQAVLASNAHSNSFGIQGTPTIFIGTARIDGYVPAQKIRETIESELAKSK